MTRGYSEVCVNFSASGAPSAYCPLCVLNTVWKLPERLLKPHLLEAVAEASGLLVRQNGFTKGHSAIGVVQEVVEADKSANWGNQYYLSHYLASREKRVQYCELERFTPIFRERFLCSWLSTPDHSELFQWQIINFWDVGGSSWEDYHGLYRSGVGDKRSIL